MTALTDRSPSAHKLAVSFAAAAAPRCFQLPDGPMTNLSIPLPHAPLAIGSAAPDLIHTSSSRTVRLSDFRGRPVVLAFFADEWDPARREYLTLYNRLVRCLPDAPAALLAIAVDGDWCRLAFADGEEQVPFLHGASDDRTARAWGVSGGQAFYLVDGDGIIRWRHVGPAPEPPRADALVAALAALAPTAREGDASYAACPSTRREFVAMALLATVALAVPPPLRAEPDVPPGERNGGPNSTARPVTLRINGREVTLTLEPQVTLLDALREYAGLTGTKKGCDHGQCGACTVHIGGRRALSCLTLAMMAQGRAITTIEGLAPPDRLHPMQAAFVEHDGFQCGYCTPGQIMSAVALLEEPCGPADADVREAMSGNLCRCGAYSNIVAAVQAVRGRAG